MHETHQTGAQDAFMETCRCSLCIARVHFMHFWTFWPCILCIGAVQFVHRTGALHAFLPGPENGTFSPQTGKTCPGVSHFLICCEKRTTQNTRASYVDRLVKILQNLDNLSTYRASDLARTTHRQSCMTDPGLPKDGQLNLPRILYPVSHPRYTPGPHRGPETNPNSPTRALSTTCRADPEGHDKNHACLPKNESIRTYVGRRRHPAPDHPPGSTARLIHPAKISARHYQAPK